MLSATCLAQAADVTDSPAGGGNSMLNGTSAQSVFLDLRGVSGLTGGMRDAWARCRAAGPLFIQR